MDKIPISLPKEITDKYDINRNTFIRKDKGDISNEFGIIIGDDKQDDFFPQLKIDRWSGETNFSVRLIDDGKDKPKIKTEGNKIKFIKNKIEAHFYDIEKGFEFEIILKEKPATNKIQMSIETKGLKFYYQPSLKEEKHDKEAVEITDTNVKDKNGKVICHRPENVVGSYAVYHESKQGDYSKMGGKNYMAGKAFHIYRPHYVDSVGKEVWCDLNIDERKKLITITIPQKFLDTAVFPIRGYDLTFGVNPASPGESSYVQFPANDIYGSLFSSPADAGIATSISVWGKASVSQPSWGHLKGIIILHSNLNIITNGIGQPSPDIDSGTRQWWTSSFSGSPSLSASTEYVLSFILDLSKMWHYYDSGDANQGHYDTSNNYSSPTNPTDASHNNYKYSIYCTYTAGGATTNIVQNIISFLAVLFSTLLFFKL